MEGTASTWMLIDKSSNFTIDEILEDRDLVLVDNSIFGNKVRGKYGQPLVGDLVYLARTISDLNKSLDRIDKEISTYQWQKDHLAASNKVRALPETTSELIPYIIHLMLNCNQLLQPGGKLQRYTTRPPGNQRSVVDEFTRNLSILRFCTITDYRHSVKRLAELACIVNETAASLTSYDGPRNLVESTVTMDKTDHAIAGAAVAYATACSDKRVGVVTNDHDIPRIVRAIANELSPIESLNLLQRVAVYCQTPQKSHTKFSLFDYCLVSQIFPRDKVNVFEPYRVKIPDSVTLPNLSLRSRR